ncbi:MAG: hypothetical protein IPM14_01745 [bacterium]|nr:hypothetical protein [bacterium]
MMKEISNVADKFILVRFYKYYIIDSIIIVKDHGLKELFKRRGWKFLLIIISYYAVRDTLIYLIIPYLAAKGIISFW